MPVDMPSFDDETDEFSTDEITEINTDKANNLPTTIPHQHQKENPSVRGWLLFFVICLSIDAARHLFTFFKDVFTASADMSLLAENVSAIFYAAFATYTVVSLLRHDTNAIFLARTCVIINIVSAAVSLLFTFLGNISLEENLILAFFVYPLKIIIDIIWFVFFKLSRQVKKDYLDGGAKTRDWLFIFLAGIIIIALVFYGVNEQVAHDAYNADPYAAFE